MAVTHTSGDADKTKAPPPKQYLLDPVGNPVATDSQALAKAYTGSGAVPITRGDAQSQANAAQHMDYVDENWGVAGKLGMGLASGLTLGIGPGMLAQQGLVDPANLRAAQASGLYTAGDLTGMALPALLSGGESLGLKGLARMTPAGLLDVAGNASERMVGSFLGESTGLMGKAIGKTAGFAARGATEGALVNMGHTIGDSLINNKPLSAEALLASSADGALFGGLLGGGIGVVGSLAGMAAQGVGGAGRAVMGRSGAAEGMVAKRLGQGVDDVVSGTEKHGTYGKYLKEEVNPVLEKGNFKLSDSEAGMKAGSKRAADGFLEDRAAALKELDTQAVSNSPSVDRMMKRMDADLAAHVDSINGPEAVKAFERAKDYIHSLETYTETPALEAVKKPGKTIKHDEFGAPLPMNKWKFEPAENVPGVEATRTANGEIPQWSKWASVRDEIAKSDKFGAFKKDILNSVDDEIQKAMRDAEMLSPETLKGMPDKYAGATAGARVAQQLEESLGRKEAAKLLSHPATITTQDLAQGGLMAAAGHPLAAAGLVAGKGALRLAGRRLEPAMAQMAYDMSIGQKAASATRVVKGKIKDTVGKFFTAGSREASEATHKSHAERKQTNTRAEYEAMASKVEQLTSANHQDKVRRYAESIYDSGYPDFAKALMQANNRTTQYMLWGMPPRHGTKQMSSIRKFPSAKGLDMNEHSYLRRSKVILNPLSVLDDFASGKVSPDQIQALKYNSPELHAEITQEVTNQIYEMKVRGETLPMSKITQLGILLDTPVDSTQEPEFVTAVQMALNAPPAQKPQGQDSSSPSASQGQISQASQDFLTPMQKQGMV